MSKDLPVVKAKTFEGLFANLLTGRIVGMVFVLFQRRAGSLSKNATALGQSGVSVLGCTGRRDAHAATTALTYWA
jgi:hypothetical protein